jgi:hypothetical protein
VVGDRNFFLGEELLHNKSTVALYIIIMHKPLSFPLAVALPPNFIASAKLAHGNDQ